AWAVHRARGRAGSYPSLVRGTARCWYGTRTAEDTSRQRFCSRASVDSVNALRSPLRGLQEAPSHGEPAPGLWRPAVPGGGRARGVPSLCDNGGVWLWGGVWHLVCVGTCCAPVLREGLRRVKDAHARVTHPPSWL